MLNNILTRNKKRKFRDQKHINFPMIGVICDKIHKKGMNINKPKTYFRLKMDQLICVLGDIDLVMNVDLVNQDVDQIMEEEVYEENME